MRRSLTLLLLLVTAAGAASAQATRIDREVTLAPGAETATVRLEHRTLLAGTLSVWAESDALDLVLRLESADGTLLAEDDDTGGGLNPWVRRPQELLGELLVVCVEAKRLEGPAQVRIGIRELPESDLTRAALANATAALEEARELDRSGESMEAVRRLSDAIDAYCANEGVRQSVSFYRTLMQMARQSMEWLDSPTYLRASLARRDAMAGLFPPTCEAWSEVHYAICSGMTRERAPGEARSACELALEFAQRCHPPGHPNIPITRVALAQAYMASRDLERARELYEQAIDEVDRCAALDPVRRAMIRGEYGSLLYELGLLDEALRWQRATLDTLLANLPEDHDFVLAASNNVAASLSAMGNSSEALAMHEQRWAVLSKRFPAEHSEAILARYNVAAVRLALGDVERAAGELEELRAIQERAGSRRSFMGDSLDVALAQAWRRSGRAEQALALLAERERIRVEEQRSDALTAWRIVSTRAHALLELGRLDEARAAAESALSLARRSLPPENPDLAEALQLAAALSLRAGPSVRGAELAREALRDAEGYFARCALALTMRQAEAAQVHWSRLVSDGLSLLAASQTPETRADGDRMAFELCESARGIGLTLLRTVNAGARAAPGEDARVRDLRSAVLASAREVARLGAAQASPAELQAALEQRARAERELREVWRAALGADSVEAVRAEQLTRTLAADEAAIAYWRHDARELELTPTAPRTARLLAFVLRGDGRVMRFDLGPLAPIEAQVERWRAAATSGDAQQATTELAAGAALHAQLLEPLAAALAGALRWRVTLDDVLHLVPFDALPEGPARLGDRVQVALTPSLFERRSAILPATQLASLVAVGGVDYEVSEGAAPGSAPRGGEARSARTWGREFEPLWETQDEIDGVAELFRRTRTGAQTARVTELSERSASKSALIAAASEASYLHVATHGFFALDTPQGSSRALDLLADRSPLTLCGLALAGANGFDAEHALDGVITADELVTLDLSRCELAVLSACDTHVGTRTAGQGVASFQKALHAAGARHVVTSLWKVDDAATRELMLAFYEALWSAGHTPEEALWAAKSALRARRAPLRDWAGWTLSR